MFSPFGISTLIAFLAGLLFFTCELIAKKMICCIGVKEAVCPFGNLGSRHVNRDDRFVVVITCAVKNVRQTSKF